MPTTELQSAGTACWSCNAALANNQPFCGACSKVQPPAADTDYFAAFGLPRKLNIDLSALERSFYRLSRKLHPDVYAQASAQEQQWSLDQTSLLNDAYRALKNPIARTEYLLRLEGVEIEAGKSADGATANEAPRESRVPADLLEEVFELNMQFEEMRITRKMGEDDPQLRHDLEKARADFESQLADCDSNLKELWSVWDAGDAAQQSAAKDKMVATLDRRRYINNLVRDVNEALDA
jgi:molecular chaperone HscB